MSERFLRVQDAPHKDKIPTAVAALPYLCVLWYIHTQNALFGQRKFVKDHEVAIC
jgi:hypothetical protein